MCLKTVWRIDRPTSISSPTDPVSPTKDSSMEYTSCQAAWRPMSSTGSHEYRAVHYSGRFRLSSRQLRVTFSVYRRGNPHLQVNSHPGGFTDSSKPSAHVIFPCQRAAYRVSQWDDIDMIPMLEGRMSGGLQVLNPSSYPLHLTVLSTIISLVYLLVSLPTKRSAPFDDFCVPHTPRLCAPPARWHRGPGQ